MTRTHTQTEREREREREYKTVYGRSNISFMSSLELNIAKTLRTHTRARTEYNRLSSEGTIYS